MKRLELIAAAIRTAREEVDARRRATSFAIRSEFAKRTAPPVRVEIPELRNPVISAGTQTAGLEPPVPSEPPPDVATAIVRPRSRRGPRPRPPIDPQRPVCRHCSNNVRCRPRGLCWPCYYSPARELYPITSKYARRGIGLGFNIGAPLPDEPTAAPPGTPEKLAVLEQRALDRVALFHPADARYPGDPRPREWTEAAAA